MPKSKELTKVDPRVRMKEIRSEVAHAVKNNIRIDQMDFNKDDTARVMIALQDQLEASNQAHNRATKHIMDQKETLQTVGCLSSLVINDATSKMLISQETVALLTKQRDGLAEECQRLSDGWEQSNGKTLELRQKLAKRGAQLDSTMHVLQTIMADDDQIEYSGEEFMVNTHG